ncbi:FHA domain-containing protein [Haliscomenobacter sp.]|uniref:FHA domain-containing protein n=1 Tax=Haliscomenobacter sp. TaxID=2717303 RepID=UPI003BAD2273
MSSPTKVFDPNDEVTTDYSSTFEQSKKHTIIDSSEFKSLTTTAKRKVLGFLVSYSKEAAGEFWPIYIGKNKIGSDSSNDIVLKEGAVSSEHAILNARRIEATGNQKEELIFIISDTNSNNGTAVNDLDLHHSNNYKSLNQFDQIKIGHYRLLFLCIDTKALNLTTDPDFIDLESVQLEDIGSSDYSEREPNKTRVISS